jgi:hypothetical protein
MKDILKKEIEGKDITKQVLENRGPGIRLRGKFFYSKKMFSWLRKDRPYGSKRESVHPRMYCELADGRVVEYTDMVEEKELVENVLARSLSEEMFPEDTQFLGYGCFHHFGEDVC